MSLRNRNPEATRIAREYIVKHPELPSRTIARHLHRDHPLVFQSIDTARHVVVYNRGSRLGGGGYCKNPLPPSPLSKKPGEGKNVEHNPFWIPPAEERQWEPFVITTDKEMSGLVMSDLHLPYHDRRAILAVVKEAKRRAVNHILINGDLLDCHHLSKFNKDPRARDFPEEIETAKQFLEMLRDEFPDAQIVYKIGNHEERYDHFIAAHAQILFGLREVELKSILGLFDLRIDYVADKRPIRYGPRLTILHGHEYGEAILAPVNPARGLFLRAKATALCGHNHQTSEHTEPTLDDKLQTCWSTGCLCDLHPAYRPLNKWNHGAAFIRLTPSGSFYLENKRINDGRIF